MPVREKTQELLASIDQEISALERDLDTLRRQRKEVARLAKRVGKSGGRGMNGAVGRSKRGKRTNWTEVIGKFSGPFTLDDLAKASGKAKPTVNQAVQILKKAGKIKPTGKRGEYKKS